MYAIFILIFLGILLSLFFILIGCDIDKKDIVEFELRKADRRDKF